MSRTPISPITQAYIDRFELEGSGEAHLKGWIFRQDTPIDRVNIMFRGKPWVANIPLEERLDVRAVFEPIIGQCPHIARSGINVTARLPDEIEVRPDTIIEIEPFRPDGSALDTWLTYFRGCSELTEALQPPVHLQDRIGGSKDYLAAGAQLASLVMTCVGK